MSTPTLVIMAAGIGSRYGGLKQVDPIGPEGELIIDYSVYDALRAGFGRVVFVIRPDIEEAFRQTVGQRVEGHVDARYVFQQLDDLPAGASPLAGRTKPWGTGHAVLAAREKVDGPFAVINADDFYGAQSFEVLARFLERADDSGEVATWALVGYVLWNTLSDHGYVSRGVCQVDDRGELAEIVERTRVEKQGESARFSEDGGDSWQTLDRDALVSMNMWGFTPRFMVEAEARFARFLAENGDSEKAEFYIPTVVDQMIRSSEVRVRVLPTEERWFGMTYREDAETAREAVAALIERGVYPRALWGGERS